MVLGLPYAIVLAGMALSWRFNRSQVFFVLLILGTTYIAASSYIPGQPPVVKPLLGNEFLQAILCLLLPFNILLFSSLRDRGVLTLHGILRISLLVIQAGLVYGLWKSQGNHLLPLLRFEFLDHKWFDRTNLTQAGVLVFGLGFAAVTLRLILRRSSIDLGYFVVLVTMAYALHRWDSQTLAWLLAGAASAMVVALVQDAYRKAYVDELTGLPGRRAMEETFLRLGGNYTVAMADIDHFKRCNDNHGHDVGDQVLRMVASVLKSVGNGGQAFRYGGEEFAIVFPGRDVDSTHDALEDLRDQVARKRFVVRSGKQGNRELRGTLDSGEFQRLNITISIGVSDNRSGGLPFDIIKQADQALYRAKKHGRNRVCS